PSADTLRGRRLRRRPLREAVPRLAPRRALRLVQRLVGEAEERLRVARVGRARGDAEARTRPLEALADALDYLACIRIRCLGEKERELVAADPERVVGLSQRLPGRGREHLQGLVPCGMAEGVVHALEAVEVAQ